MGLLTCTLAHAEVTGTCWEWKVCSLRRKFTGVQKERRRRGAARERPPCKSLLRLLFAFPPLPTPAPPPLHLKTEEPRAWARLEPANSVACLYTVTRACCRPGCPTAAEIRGRGCGFQRLDGLCWHPPWGQLILIIFPSLGVGVGTGGAGSQLPLGGGPPESESESRVSWEPCIQLPPLLSFQTPAAQWARFPQGQRR